MENSIRIMKLCLLISLVLSIVTCKIKNEAELHGTYIADYPVAKEKLILHKDGTFTQEVTLKTTSSIAIVKGSWIYNPGTGYLRFSNFMSVLNGFRQLNPNYSQSLGSAVLPVDRYLGYVSLGSSEGVLYKKTGTDGAGGR